jgi:glycerate-2-kinase
MSVRSLVSSIKSERIVSIDPSSHSLAWVIYDVTLDEIKLVANGKIDYKKDGINNMKYKHISTKIIFDKHKLINVHCLK